MVRHRHGAPTPLLHLLSWDLIMSASPLLSSRSQVALVSCLVDLTLARLAKEGRLRLRVQVPLLPLQIRIVQW